MARMTGFVFQDKYLKRLEKLSDQEVGRLVRALATYHASGEEPELKGRECGYYDFIKADIDEIEQAYQNKCKNMKRGELKATDSNCGQLGAIDGNCGQMPINININKNKKEIYIDDDTRAREDTVFGTVDIDPLILKAQRELNGLTDTHYSELGEYRDELTDEVVSHAIDNAIGNGVRNWNYVAAILREYTKNHVHSIGEAKALDEKRKAEPSKSAKTVRAQQYAQREYNEKELESKLGVNDIFAADWKGAG